jgi:hypothetical protein
MVYDFKKGLQALTQLYQGLEAQMKPYTDKIEANEKQIGTLGQLIGKLVDPRNPSKGLVPELNNAQRGALSQDPDFVVDAYKNSKDAKKSILQIGKEYISKAKGEFQNLLIKMFSALYGEYALSYKQAKYTANGPMMKPKVAERINDAASILK